MRRGRMLASRARPRNSSKPSPLVYALIAAACLTMGFTASHRTSSLPRPELPRLTLPRGVRKEAFPGGP